jgi:pimeloyl-ACP methyl ester carboxylesterase
MGQIWETGLWPIYGDDGYFEKFADTDVPILMLNGTLDPQTPLSIAEPTAAIFNGPHQQFITVPWSPHGVLFNSYTAAALETGGGDLAGVFPS